STPDTTLLTDAGAGTLADPTAFTATVTRMMTDPKIDRLVRNFSGQWLGIRGVAGHRAFPIQFPDWSPELGASMAEEEYLYFGQFVRTALPWTEFIHADMNFVDSRLAAFYGMPDPGAAGFTQVSVPDDQRQGFLGLGGFLAGSSFPQRTSPTLRAKRILSDLLCSPPPDPPPGVKAAVDAAQAAAEAQAQTTSDMTDIRAFLDAHRTMPDCKACHALFDPYGMALENFDGIGKYRTAYPNGAAIDPTATLIDGTMLNGLPSVVTSITANPKLSSCVSQKMFIYSLGRTTVTTDQPYLDNIVYNWASGTDPSLRGLVQQLVTSEPFQMRRGMVTN
ncbi:MAG TPA: DUF1592 domain-containing protein, partial [Polyangiaceae bacterium]|nr:DUF1592 domain-containing protein [Polyangiaceae bacterium]